jgi:hypothetical protein
MSIHGLELRYDAKSFDRLLLLRYLLVVLDRLRLRLSTLRPATQR